VGGITIPETIIKAEGVLKVYETEELKVNALNGISLELQAGEMVSVVGPSGCGKTTLLNCLSGLDSVNAGTIKIAGEDISKMDDTRKSAYRARSIGFVFQFYNLLPVLNAQENVELPLLLARVKPEEARKRSLAVLEQVGLADWHCHMPSELSGGQRQRVTIARALVNKPAIVFADEPTGDLDSKTSREIMDLLLDLNRCEGTTFMIVTHDNELADRTRRKIFMKDGMIEEDKRNQDYDFTCPAAFSDARLAQKDFVTRKKA